MTLGDYPAALSAANQWLEPLPYTTFIEVAQLNGRVP